MSSYFTVTKPVLLALLFGCFLIFPMKSFLAWRSTSCKLPSITMQNEDERMINESFDGSRIRVLSWNLEKRDLVDWSLNNRAGFGKVDVALFQENSIKFRSQTPGYNSFEATSFDTFGTAIFSTAKHIADYSVASPHGDYRAQFWKGRIYKATAVAVLDNGLTVVSFHGFNGSLQGRNPAMLVDHILEVFKVISGRGPCIFAGDFNTFTEDHHKAVDTLMTSLGFHRGIVVPYDERKTLDMVYSRACRVNLIASNHHESDHPYLIFDVEIST